jgi:Na+/H+-dicarboxylate symporter
MSQKKKLSLTAKILIGMVFGILLGSLLNESYSNETWVKPYLVEGLFGTFGTIFINALKMLVVPLVLVSLICGTAALDDARRVGTVGVKAVSLYLLTTAIAITMALVFALIVNPGKGIDPDKFIEKEILEKSDVEKQVVLLENELDTVKTVINEVATNQLQLVPPFQLDEKKEETAVSTFVPGKAPPLKDVIINIFPSNPFQAMVQGNMLQIIVFAVLFGLALTMSGDRGKRVLAIFQDLNEVVMKLVMILIELAPYGVFCLVSRTFATQGFDAIWPLAKYFFLVVGVLIIHVAVVYPLLLKLFTGLNPIMFLRKMRNAQVFAFSTASSNATIPVTLRAVEDRIGVDNSVASFTVPLGATINMDGTAIMQGAATIFIAQAYGIDLTLGNLLTVIFTATIASVGTAGVPSAGLIMLSVVLTQLGLPVDAIAIIWGIDRLLDMVRTSVNITGDAMVTTIVGKWEGQLDVGTFNKNIAADGTIEQ